MKILVFDTETTGLPEKDASIYNFNQWPYIVQLSYIMYDISDNDIITRDYYIKLNSNIEITKESQEKHNLTHEFLQNKGHNIIPVMREFNQALKICHIVIGHNISFDKRMVFVECLRNKIDQNFTKFSHNGKITKPEYCTMKNTKDFCNIIRLTKTNKTFIKQPTLLELYNKLFPDSPDPNNLHNSMVDVLCTMRCYLKYVHNIDIIEINEEVKKMLLKN
tara:strand:- start:243 stop:902 length:660 start_codon:yes stop_codon:yes gene_type:complete